MNIVAAVDPTVSSTIAENVTEFPTELLAVAGIGIGIGVVVLLLRRGWQLFKGFTR